MVFARNASGIAAILALTIGLNLLLVRETLFEPIVLVPLLAGCALVAIWFVLWLAALARKQGHSPAGLINALLSSFFVLGIAITAYAITAREAWSWDLTHEGRRELAPQTKLVLQSLTEPVEIVCFFVHAGDDRIRTAQDKTRRFLEHCGVYTDRIDTVFIDPQQHPEQVQKYGALGVQKSQVGSVMLISGPRRREIPLSDVNARLEERDFTNALINVSRNAAPKLYFLSGHGGWDLQSDDPKQGSREFANLLTRESYEIAQLSITPESPTVPPDCSVLVINGFTDDLRAYEVDALDQYIVDGGRLLALVNPLYKVQEDTPTVERFRPWLDRRFGLELPTEVLVSTETGGYQLVYLPDFSVFPGYQETGDAPFRGSYHAAHPITRGMDKQLVMNFARSVRSRPELPEGVTHTTLLRTTPGTWGETDLDAVMNRKPIRPDPGELQGPNPVAVAVTAQAEVDVANESRPEESRAVVIGNAYISTNEFMLYAGVQDLLLNSLAWLTESEELIAIRPTTSSDQPLVLTRSQQRWVAWIASLGTVQAVALIGVVVLLSRRRYR